MSRTIWLLFLVLVASGILYLLSHSVAGVPAIGALLDPWDGLYRTARNAEHEASSTLNLPGLDQEVTVVRDDRGAPHIFAQTDHDAVMAMGYVVAQDRLFQLDFIPRAASGRLAAALGSGALPADQFLRRIGMELGARRNLDRILQANRVEKDLVEWYAAGVNAWIDSLDDGDLPFEFRLLGYRPDRYTPMQSMRLLQYMTYDLTFRSDEAAYEKIRARLSPEEFRKLYPVHSQLFAPMVPGSGVEEPSGAHENRVLQSLLSGASFQGAAPLFEGLPQGALMEGFVEGKGSNNWAVSGALSTTGSPILAGDMHLSLSLPALWYEVHLVTPNMNVYGVTIPGAPVLVEAFNDHLGWTFTNTGADQIDHLLLQLNESKTHYRYEDGWRNLEVVPDTIFVKGADPVVDTLYYAHWGPVLMGSDAAVALRWTAHDASRTLLALWEMGRSRNYNDFEAALRNWDTPMQNILYADAEGNIAIRSTGYLPLRKSGHGMGLLDGSDDAFAWIGRAPFEELPHAVNPARGWLSSTNQQPADSTYPYYLGFDWSDAYRSLRIRDLMEAKERHSVDDLKRYQSDVHAVQYDLFFPLLDTLSGLSPQADTLRAMLARWNGETEVDRPEPLILDEFLMALRRLAWDESVFFEDAYARVRAEGSADAGRYAAPAIGAIPRPKDVQLLSLLRKEPDAHWLDVQRTQQSEDASGLLRLALETTADTLESRYGWDAESWRWGDHHKIVFRHLTRSEALRPLWRGPMEYPGFTATLSPAAGRLTTHSASWRMVVDFSTTPPTGYGIYPGGAQGNPFSRFYDLHVPDYVHFRHYRLHKPEYPSDLPDSAVSSRLYLNPE